MYWLVSLPGEREQTWRALQQATGNGSLSTNYRFEVPMSLRVGSLDALMVLSDDLNRINIMVEGVVNKIRRQASDLAPDQALQVNNRPVASYLTNFHWDEAKYPLRRSLKEIVDDLTESVDSVDDDLKVRSFTPVPACLWCTASTQAASALSELAGTSPLASTVRRLAPTPCACVWRHGATAPQLSASPSDVAHSHARDLRCMSAAEVPQSVTPHAPPRRPRRQNTRASSSRCKRSTARPAAPSR